MPTSMGRSWGDWVERFHCRESGFEGWRARISQGRGLPTPAVGADGRVYLGGGFGSHEFYCLDVETGQLAWRLRTGDDGPTAGVLSGSYLAFNTESCTLYVADAGTGCVVWQKWLGDPLLSQPAVVGGAAIYAVFPRRGQHWLGAFHLEDGHALWEQPLSHDAITAVVGVEDKVFLSTFDGKVWCFTAKEGQLLWCEDRQATSAPWVVGEKVYVACKRKVAEAGDRRERNTQARRQERAGGERTNAPYESIASVYGKHGKEEMLYNSKFAPYLRAKRGLPGMEGWQEEDAKVGFGAAPASAKLHIAEDTVGEHLVSRAQRYQGSRPVVVDGILYQVTGDELEATNADTGETIWKWCSHHHGSFERSITPPAVANGRVWAGTLDGRVLCWDARSGEVQWSVHVGGPVHWQPAVRGGRVFVGLETGELVVFATGNPKDDGWPMWGGGPGHNLN
ncbi:MAG: hypothetical protein KatS3mg077_1197 [Candidatus Binatia bacterium]|nr:MAG: hypothetical protein KatS3mg077_1197 [Candidatus Binatia bacterium]